MTRHLIIVPAPASEGSSVIVVSRWLWPGNRTFLAPLTTSAQRSWWYYWFVRRRPSVNFCFKSLLLLQFLFNHSEFFTGETSHIVPPCNKAGISNFCLEFQKLQKFQISWKRYSSFSHSEIYTGETRHIVPPYNKARISNFCLEFQKLQKYSRNCRNSKWWF